MTADDADFADVLRTRLVSRAWSLHRQILLRNFGEKSLPSSTKASATIAPNQGGSRGPGSARVPASAVRRLAEQGFPAGRRKLQAGTRAFPSPSARQPFENFFRHLLYPLAATASGNGRSINFAAGKIYRHSCLGYWRWSCCFNLG